MFPTPIECSMEESIRIMFAPRTSRVYSSCALIKSISVSGSGPSSRMEPASENGTPARTHSKKTPRVSTPCSTACLMPPQRRIVLIAAR